MENKNSNNINTSQNYKLNSLVSYQEGSVVSRQIMTKTKATLTVFAFDKGQALSEHSAPFDALVQVVEGTGDIIIDGISHKLEAGEIILMPANIPHAVKAPTQFKMLLTMIKSE